MELAKALSLTFDQADKPTEVEPFSEIDFGGISDLLMATARAMDENERAAHKEPIKRVQYKKAEGVEIAAQEGVSTGAAQQYYVKQEEPKPEEKGREAEWKTQEFKAQDAKAQEGKHARAEAEETGNEKQEVQNTRAQVDNDDGEEAKLQTEKLGTECIFISFRSLLCM